MEVGGAEGGDGCGGTSPEEERELTEREVSTQQQLHLGLHPSTPAYSEFQMQSGRCGLPLFCQPQHTTMSSAPPHPTVDHR